MAGALASLCGLSPYSGSMMTELTQLPGVLAAEVIGVDSNGRPLICATASHPSPPTPSGRRARRCGAIASARACSSASSAVTKRNPSCSVCWSHRRRSAIQIQQPGRRPIPFASQQDGSL